MTSVGMPDVRIYVGLNGPTVGAVFTVGDPTLGQVGVVQIGDDDTWSDVTAYVRSWSIRRGATNGDSPTLRYEAGTCTVVLNDGDRRFDPDNLAGPYVSAGVSQIGPNVRVKIVGTWEDVTYPLFYGFTDDFAPDYDGNSWTTVTMTATDATKLFAGEDRDASVAAGAGEDSAARIGRILDAYGWPAGSRFLSTGNSFLQATDLSGNMWAEMLVVQDTELGELYIDRQGLVRFRNRKATLIASRSTTSQATFGDDPAGYATSGELPYADVKMSSPADTLVNSVSASRAGGTEQLVEDVTSQSKYLKRTHTRNDLAMQADADANSWAHSIIYQFSVPARRFARLEFNRPRISEASALWPHLLGREFADRITVTRRPPGGGSPIVRDCFIRGVEMSSDGHIYSQAFILQDAGRFAFFAVGDPILGRVGYNAISY